MDIKWNSHQSRGQCQICKGINHTSIWKVFLQDGWFRGDDIYLGKLCKGCKTTENINKIVTERVKAN